MKIPFISDYLSHLDEMNQRQQQLAIEEAQVIEENDQQQQWRNAIAAYY